MSILIWKTDKKKIFWKVWWKASLKRDHRRKCTCTSLNKFSTLKYSHAFFAFFILKYHWTSLPNVKNQLLWCWTGLGRILKKNVFFRALLPPPSPQPSRQLGKVGPLFWNSKNNTQMPRVTLKRGFPNNLKESSKFDFLVLLRSTLFYWPKKQLVKNQVIVASPPPLFGQCPKERKLSSVPGPSHSLYIKDTFDAIKCTEQIRYRFSVILVKWTALVLVLS